MFSFGKFLDVVLVVYGTHFQPERENETRSRFPILIEPEARCGEEKPLLAVPIVGLVGCI